jgi:hypothetical protein
MQCWQSEISLFAIVITIARRDIPMAISSTALFNLIVILTIGAVAGLEGAFISVRLTAVPQ